MSTLNVSNISDGTDTVGTGYVVNGSAKAWVNFNGTGTAAIRDSFNIASLTDNGTGDYTVNFSNVFSSGDYSAVSQGGRGTTGAVNTLVIGPMTINPTTSAFRLQSFNSSFSNSDGGFVYLSTHGDLA
jgi:hypothetical protein